ncbi:hypothetical protein B0H16DRAFT_1600936 [Mycena metata]|uniref:Uncharacterized protein n=1 Tax=Mycena metata TaxID=1033252 RepID=A0AAD7HKN0_9AGAR|nr:hypothetical protein B0H16DRAFT_1600936 [Mycena metata]
MLKHSTRFDDLTKSQTATLMSEFEAAKAQRKKVVQPCPSHAAAAHEVTTWENRIDSEIAALWERTGALALLVIGRSDVANTLKLGIYGVPDALDYFTQVMHCTPNQFCLKFDHYGVNRVAVGLEVGYATLRKETTAMITDHLESKISKKVHMKYNNYDSMLTEYGYELIGSPQDIPFQAPSNLATVDKLRPLRDALVADTFRWEPMLDAHRAEHAAKVAAGAAGTVKKKKERSDKGKTRDEAAALREKRKLDDGDGEDGGKKKRAKHTDLSGYTEEESAAHVREREARKKRQQRVRKRGVEYVSADGGGPARKRKKAEEGGGGDEGGDSESGGEGEEAPVKKKAKLPGRGRGCGIVSRATISHSDAEYAPAKEKGKAKPAAQEEEDEESSDPDVPRSTLPHQQKMP